MYLREPLRGGCQISLCISESPSAGGAPQNGPSTGVLDRSTPLDGGQIYRCNGSPAPPSDTDPGEIGQNPAPPSFWLRNPLALGRLGNICSGILLNLACTTFILRQEHPLHDLGPGDPERGAAPGPPRLAHAVPPLLALPHRVGAGTARSNLINFNYLGNLRQVFPLSERAKRAKKV